VTPTPPVLRIPHSGRLITFERPLVMGIVNINDDSFSGDGTLDPAEAIARARELIAAGADIIDVGAESARTNRPAISPAEEIDRLQPFLESYRDLAESPATRRLDDRQLWPPLLSINTWRPEVAAAVLPMGCDLLNDMGALPDPANARLCAAHGSALLVMHSVGQPKIPHTHCEWPDLMASMQAFFEEKLAMAAAAGLPDDATVIDPGIDFAKQKDANLELLRHAGQLARFHRPVLLPISRKTVIGEVLGLPDPRDRDAGTIACLAAGMLRLPATIFRVHTVTAAAQATRVLQAVLLP
jgi:dihydropteroate synthase